MYEQGIAIIKMQEYERGYREGYLKALEQLPKLINSLSSPRIIVTSAESIERIKREIREGE